MLGKSNFKVICLILMALFFVSCTHKYARNELIRQILRPLEGHTGLTNTLCLEKNWKGDCKKAETVDYDLNDIEIRQKLVDFSFVCRIKGQRFQIDLEAPGFVRYGFEKPCFICKKRPIVLERIPISAYQYLLDAEAECYSESIYPGGIY